MVFEGEKTLVFWVGLLVFGYSLTQFCGAVGQAIYYLSIYPQAYPLTSNQSLLAFFQAQLALSASPLITSGVIFAVIGLYMMKKGVKQEQPSTQN
jgi:hypothetical protein